MLLPLIVPHRAAVSTVSVLLWRAVQHHSQGQFGQPGNEKQILGIPAQGDHAVKDRPRLISVQPHPGQVLQPQTAVAVDLGARQPRLQLGRSPA
jgi:hypothetical protein